MNEGITEENGKSGRRSRAGAQVILGKPPFINSGSNPFTKSDGWRLNQGHKIFRMRCMSSKTRLTASRAGSLVKEMKAVPKVKFPQKGLFSPVPAPLSRAEARNRLVVIEEIGRVDKEIKRQACNRRMLVERLQQVPERN